MRWPRPSALVLLAALALPAAAQQSPLLVVLDAADAEQWRKWSAAAGWRVLAPPAEPPASLDARLLALVPRVEAALGEGGGAVPVYLAGRGDAASALFYAVARLPGLWTAAAAIGGSPQPAIDSARFFTANFQHVPLLWISGGPDDKVLAANLKSAGLELEWREPSGTSPDAVLAWLRDKHRDPFPAEVDCETSSPQFASCYWIRITRFDGAARNDVLPTTRFQPGSGAELDLGGFGFRRDDPGPGIEVTWLPAKYSGLLKLKDRIVAIGGRSVKDGREYIEILSRTLEEKAAVVMVERGTQRVRLDSRIVLPQREAFTARVQGRYSAEDREIQLISRAITEMRVMVPEPWTGAMLNWNGTPLVKADRPGCWLLVEDKQLQSARPCP